MKSEKEKDSAIETTALKISSNDFPSSEILDPFEHPRISCVSKASSVDEKSGQLEISCNLFKSCVGIGILSLSYAYKESGIILTSFLIAICSFLTYWSISVCVQVADHANIRIQSFSDLSSLITGKWGLCIARFCVLIYQVGICSVYVSFFGLFFNNVFCYAGIDSLCTYIGLDFALCLLLIIPLSLVKNLANYNRFSLLGNFFAILALLIIFVISCKRISSNGIQGDHLFIAEKIPFCFGIAIFAIECIGTVFEMRDSMKNPENFQSVLKKTFSTITIIYILLPSIFYLSFGDEVKELIVFNIGIENPLGMLNQILFALSLCITYPLNLFPVFFIVEKVLDGSKENIFIEKKDNKKQKTLNKIKIYTSRLIIVCLIILISWVMPGIVVLINLVGAFGSTIVGMVLPVVIGEYYRQINKDFKKDYQLYSRIINWISMTTGIIGGGCTIFFSIMNIAKGS